MMPLSTSFHILLNTKGANLVEIIKRNKFFDAHLEFGLDFEWI